MDLTWKYASTVDASIIEETAQKNGVILPQLLKRVIQEGNNGAPSKRLFVYGNNENVFKTLLSYRRSDIENVYSALEELKELGKGLYPFGNDPAGNFICLQGNQVVLWRHEDGAIMPVSENVDLFFESLH